MMSGSGDADRQALVSEFEIFRGDLSRILYGLSAGHERIRYVFGEQIAAVRHRGAAQDGPVTVEFASGAPAAKASIPAWQLAATKSASTTEAGSSS